MIFTITFFHKGVKVPGTVRRLDLQPAKYIVQTHDYDILKIPLSLVLTGNKETRDFDYRTIPAYEELAAAIALALRDYCLMYNVPIS